MTDFTVDPYAVLLRDKYLPLIEQRRHTDNLPYNEQYSLTQPIFGVILITSPWPYVNDAFIQQLRQLQQHTKQLTDTHQPGSDPILWTAGNALHITLSTVLRFDTNILDATYYNDSCVKPRLQRIYADTPPTAELIQLRRQCLYDWIDITQRVTAELNITQPVTVTVSSIKLFHNACVGLVTDNTGTILKIRELLQQHTAQHAHAEQLLNMIRVPNIMHTTLFRFVDTIQNAAVFRQQFERVAAQWQPVDVVLSGYELICETVPYMHWLPHSEVTVLKHIFADHVA